MTTVGYGDSYPKTDASRVIAMVVMIVGIGFVALLRAAAADRFMRARHDEEDRIEQHLADISTRLASLEARAEKR